MEMCVRWQKLLLGEEQPGEAGAGRGVGRVVTEAEQRGGPEIETELCWRQQEIGTAQRRLCGGC